MDPEEEVASSSGTGFFAPSYFAPSYFAPSYFAPGFEFPPAPAQKIDRRPGRIVIADGGLVDDEELMFWIL